MKTAQEAWQGPAAQSYAAAHMHYHAWLIQRSITYARITAALEMTAAAYTAAVAAMPTLTELIANHTIHAALAGTNFFGINTIPLTLNEIDYVRMWIQAAITMTTYEAACTTQLMSAPKTTPAPLLLNSDIGAAPALAAAAIAPITISTLITLLVQALIYIESIIYSVVALLTFPLSLFVYLISYTVLTFFGGADGILLPPYVALLIYLFPLFAVGAPSIPIAVSISVPLGVDRLLHDAKTADFAKEELVKNISSQPASTPSTTVAVDEQSAGALGFAGTAHQERVVQPSGLTKLTDGGFGENSHVPLMPSTWG